jgi:hypothetical protein
LRRAADKIYTLRGFIGLRRREEGDLELGLSSIEDEIIRHVLFSFGSFEKLCTAVRKYCPLRENAEIIRDIWAASVFIQDIQGITQKPYVNWRQRTRKKMRLPAQMARLAISICILHWRDTTRQYRISSIPVRL